MQIISRIGLLAAPALGILLVSPAGVYAQAPDTATPADAAIHAEVQKALDKKQFSGVQVAVNNGVVTLSGQVGRYADKEDADRRTHHLRNVTAVSNMIEVAVPEGYSDQALGQKLAKGLEYDRVGYGTTVFNSISLGVQNGVVTLSGTVYGPPDKDSALGLVANTPGVRDIVDNLEVAPLSPMDDRIRIAEARAIYGYPALNRYALDPGKTIRITVVNGNVTLSGVVDNQNDKDLANLRARGVPGVFAVQNNLQVAGAQPGK